MMKDAPSFVSHANLPLAVRSRMHAGKSHPMATAAIAPVIVCTTQGHLYGFSRASSCTTRHSHNTTCHCAQTTDSALTRHDSHQQSIYHTMQDEQDTTGRVP